MATELEITKKIFYSDYHNLYSIDQIAIEDCKFLKFTEFLDDTDVFNTPVISRENGTYKKGNWGLLGYCCKSYQTLEEELDDDDDDSVNELEFQWEYTIFHGFFSDNTSVTNATKLEVTKSVNEVTRFIEKTFANNLINDVCEAKDLQSELLKQHKKKALERLDICIITDKIISQENLESKVTIENLNLECRIYYWDLKRWNDLKRSKSKREAIDIDFQKKEFSIYKVDYLERKVNEKLAYYLAIFPADLIADLYDYNNTRLLENNVRVFLSANRKANKAIRETIRDEANHFFSYNNGISATAESVDIKDSKIIKINDFQIVNGGQTTATIHHSRKKLDLDLNNVFVAVKITALKKDENYGKTVSNISKAANTQSAIKSSDFYANDPMLIGIERLTLKNPTTNQELLSIYYYFERMAGQYNVTRNSRGTDRNIKAWEVNHPKKLSFNKVDVSRWSNTMQLLPHISVLSAEKQFTNFMNDKDFIREGITLGRYKTLIGFGMLCERARKLCGTKKGRDYPSIIGDSSVGMATTIYAMSYLHFMTKGCIDYWGIYEYKYGVCDALVDKNRIKSDFDDILESIIKACWKQIAKYGGSSAQEQTKNIKCWEFVKENIEISNNISEQLKSLIISLKEKESRESEVLNKEDVNYFSSLNILLEKDAFILKQLLVTSGTQSNFKSENTILKNLIKKIKKRDSNLTRKKVKEVSSFYKRLKNEGYIFNEELKDFDLMVDINCRVIYDQIFSNKAQFIKVSDKFTLDNERDFEENYNLRAGVMELIEKYDREYGLSIDDLNKFQEYLRKINSLVLN